MAYIIDLKTIEDNRGKLNVIEKVLPFEMKRVYYMYDVPKNVVRGGHRHKKTIQAAVCLNGSCTIFINNGKEQKDIKLTHPSQLLILEPEDWHSMREFSKGSVLMVIASDCYDASDYIHEEYP